MTVQAIRGLAIVGLLSCLSCGSQLKTSDWRYYGSDAASTKYAAIDQIDSTNVTQLQMVWRWRGPDGELLKRRDADSRGSSNENTPIVVNGVLYALTGAGVVAALDAATGKQLWLFDAGAWKTLSSFPIHRGVTYWEGAGKKRILFGNSSAELFSLDATTGQPDPEFGIGGRIDLLEGLRNVTNADESRMRYGVTSPPIVCRDVLIVGSSIPDKSDPYAIYPAGDVRGYDVRTGELLWTFHTVPREGEFGVDSWEEASWEQAGRNNVWSMMSADEGLGYVYLPTGSPPSNHYGGLRPGDNLFSLSLVCLDARTGKRVWHFQMTHHDLWDYDAAAAPILVDINVDGKLIKAVAQVTKQAMCFVFDRVTGEPVWPIEERPVPQSKVPPEKSSPTQPFQLRPAPFDRVGLSEDDLIDFTPDLRQEALEIIGQYEYGPLYTPPSVKGTIAMPGGLGGGDWVGAAANPHTGWLHVPSKTFVNIMRIRPLDDADSSGHYRGSQPRGIKGPRGLPLVKPPYGRITTIDLNTGERVWTKPMGIGPVNHPALKGLDLPPLGWNTRYFVVATPTLLLVTSQPADDFMRQDFFVDPAAYLWALNPENGDVIATIDLPNNTYGNPMTYMVNERQYIVAPLGAVGRPPELVAYALPREGEQLPVQPRNRTDADHPAFYDAVAAVSDGDLNQLRLLLEKSPALATARGYLDSFYVYEEFRGATLLHHVAGNPKLAELQPNAMEIVQLLLDAGSDPAATTLDSVGTLSLAIDSDQLNWLGTRKDLIELLLSSGADVNENNGYLLWQATHSDEEEFATLFREYGATCDLRLAASFNLVDTAKDLFKADGSLTTEAHNGHQRSGARMSPADDQQVLNEALAYGAARGSLEMVRFLVERGAALQSMIPKWYWYGDLGTTALHKAAGGGHLETVQFLLSVGADPTHIDQWKNTPRVWAEREGHDDVAAVLEEAEAAAGSGE